MTEEQAHSLFRSTDLVGVGFQADAVRKRLHPEQVVSYAVLDDGVGLEPSAQAVLEMTAESTVDERLEQLYRLRQEQEASNRFVSFTLVPAGKREVTAAEYLKMFAIARVWLDNIAHAQLPIAHTDSKLAQVALRFGANDLGAIPCGDSGKEKQVTEEQVRRLIRDAGFVPRRRDSLFQTYFL